MSYRKKEQRKQRLSRIAAAVAITICVAATLGYLRSRLWIIDLSYQFTQLGQELVEIKKENARVKTDVGRLRSPARLNRIARDELGLKTRDEVRGKYDVVEIESTP